MLKELKYPFYLLIITLSIFFSLKYYFSEANKKNSYRSLNSMDNKISSISKDLILLKNDTNNIVEYIEKSSDKNKKNYNFWKLINNNE